MGVLSHDEVAHILLQYGTRFHAWRWSRSHDASPEWLCGVDISAEDGALATWIHVDSPGLCRQVERSVYVTALCDEEMQARGGPYYAEFTRADEGYGHVFVGVARPTYNPNESDRSHHGARRKARVANELAVANASEQTDSFDIQPGNEMSTLSDGWVVLAEVGETVGLLLRAGSLSVCRGGVCTGTLCEGLSGSLVWAVDLAHGAVRIAGAWRMIMGEATTPTF